ncbi:pyridoxal phosphate-dependent aminotransferase [bacterium]|nr:MAG: pyridoxal phosphate-dependent aminotransferase [bacterium]
MKLDTIKAMERIARNDTTVISLGQGIPSGTMDPALKQAAINAVTYGIADSYSDPQGIYELRSAISQSTAAENMVYSPDEILVTSGAIEAINVAIRSVVAEKRNEVIIPTPTYSAYFSVVTQNGGTVVDYQTTFSNNWQIDCDAIQECIRPCTAAVLLCNPNNPTGTVYDQAIIRQLAQLAKDNGIVLIIDEVYRHMMHDDTPFYSPAEDTRYKDSIIRIMSFSKDFMMTGWRVGYIQSSASRIKDMVAIHDTLVNCTPVVSQHVAIAALKHQDRILTANATIYRARLAQMSTLLATSVPGLTVMSPMAGYYLFAKLPGNLPSRIFAEQLVGVGVIVIPGSAFGSAGEGYVRICFGRSAAAITAGIERMHRYYAAQ